MHINIRMERSHCYWIDIQVETHSWISTRNGRRRAKEIPITFPSPKSSSPPPVQEMQTYQNINSITQLQFHSKTASLEKVKLKDDSLTSLKTMICIQI